MKIPISIVVLTKNEECNILGCLQALLAICDDVSVVDSGSTDRTVELAKELGARVFQNQFTGFGDQRNWTIENIPFAHDWVFHFDADERPTEEFSQELAEIVGRDPAEAGFYVPSKTMLANKWLKYSSGYPVYQVRLFHKSRLRFENHGHGQREVTTGKIGYMRSPYLHYAFSKGVTEWFKKHAEYAHVECDKIVSDDAGSFLNQLQNALTFDQVERRRAIKVLSNKVPCRSMVRFLHLYVLKRGFLDGLAGLSYARMVAAYEAMISVNLLFRHRAP